MQHALTMTKSMHAFLLPCTLAHSVCAQFLASWAHAAMAVRLPNSPLRMATTPTARNPRQFRYANTSMHHLLHPHSCLVICGLFVDCAVACRSCARSGLHTRCMYALACMHQGAPTPTTPQTWPPTLLLPLSQFMLCAGQAS